MEGYQLNNLRALYLLKLLSSMSLYLVYWVMFLRKESMDIKCLSDRVNSAID